MNIIPGYLLKFKIGNWEAEYKQNRLRKDIINFGRGFLTFNLDNNEEQCPRIKLQP